MMTFTVTIQGMLIVLLGIIAVVVGIYLLIVLKNANRLILNANKTLAENQANINKVLLHLEEVSNSTAKVTGVLGKQFEKNELIVRSIFETGADSMLLLNDATSNFRTLITNINEIVKFVSSVFNKIK